MKYEIIPFGNHEFFTFEDGGEIRIVMKPVCEVFGIDWKGQLERIKRHPVLSRGIRVTRIPMGSHDQEMVTLDLENFHGWLVTISSERIADPEKRAVIVEYQRRAFRVIYEHFHGPMVSRDSRLSVDDMIKLQRERRALAKALIRETHPIERVSLYADLLRTNARLGAETPPIEQLGQSVLSLADQSAPFFDVLAALDAKGVVWNHSKKPDKLWAVSMPEVTRMAVEQGIAFRFNDDMAFALRSDERFVAAKTVKSITGRTLHCWVFEALAA